MQCQRVRAALSQQVPGFAERDFFKERFSVEELRALAGSRPIAELFSYRSTSIAKFRLEPAEMTEEQMLEWMAKEPRLIRRPLLVVNGELVIQPKAKRLEELLR